MTDALIITGLLALLWLLCMAFLLVLLVKVKRLRDLLGKVLDRFDEV